MLTVQINTGTGIKHIRNISTSITVNHLWNYLKTVIEISKDEFYIIHNGKYVYGTDILFEGSATIIPRLCGGKGGFGSMLRAIGAQIEKTTNREACRDLSGRRLRDINEEKRLKAWIEKQGKREEETAERKKRKLEKLCAEPRHEFKDKNYDRERSVLTERVGAAVEEGFKAAAASAIAVAGNSSIKRKVDEESKPNKRKMLLDFEIDSDELSTSEDECDDQDNTNQCRLRKIDTLNQQLSTDSGHSSDETVEKSSKSSVISNIESTTENDVGQKNASEIDYINKKESLGDDKVSKETILSKHMEDLSSTL